MTRLERMLAGTPYAGYAYAYPHKSAYRTLSPPVPLREAWQEEGRSALFLYLHVPFCEMRCGFCNLFTTTNPPDEWTEQYLDALEREAAQVREAVGSLQIARMAVGGGTPTYLSAKGLQRLFHIVQEYYGVRPGAIPISVETSPTTATPDRLEALAADGATRISIGVQSLEESEVRAAGRPQRSVDVEEAIGRIRSLRFPTLNLDLIYGLPGQSVESWLHSLERALEFAPEELYLYPLYVRPLTGLGNRGTQTWDELRLACYRAGRDLLLTRGYRQHSMRMFRRNGPLLPGETPGPLYCCQEDGMIGLGCGARSYTRTLHYSSEFAVGWAGVREILGEYLQRSAAEFGVAAHGATLNAEEQRRRYLLKSLLQAEGLILADYRSRFGCEPDHDFPELAELTTHGLASPSPEHLRLTEAGLERSDLIGPWLYSEAVHHLSELFPLR